MVRRKADPAATEPNPPVSAFSFKGRSSAEQTCAEKVLFEKKRRSTKSDAVRLRAALSLPLLLKDIPYWHFRKSVASDRSADNVLTILAFCTELFS